jgi:hypothetical protein
LAPKKLPEGTGILSFTVPNVTLSVYAHLMKPVNQAAACRLENTIFLSTGSRMVAGNEKGVTEKSVTP